MLTCMRVLGGKKFYVFGKHCARNKCMIPLINVSDHFGTLCIKGLINASTKNFTKKQYPLNRGRKLKLYKTFRR